MLYEGSRYLTAIPYISNKRIVSLSRRRRQKYNKENCSIYTVTQGETLDGISSKVYGTSSLWLAILDANPQYQTELDLKSGDSILIPDYDEVVVNIL